MSIEPDVSMMNVQFAGGRSSAAMLRVDTPMRTSAVPSSARGAGPDSTVTPRSLFVGSGSASSNALSHSSGRMESGSGRKPPSRNVRATLNDPVSTSSPNVDSASTLVTTNVESPPSTNTLSSSGPGPVGGLGRDHCRGLVRDGAARGSWFQFRR